MEIKLRQQYNINLVKDVHITIKHRTIYIAEILYDINSDTSRVDYVEYYSDISQSKSSLLIIMIIDYTRYYEQANFGIIDLYTIDKYSSKDRPVNRDKQVDDPALNRSVSPALPLSNLNIKP